MPSPQLKIQPNIQSKLQASSAEDLYAEAKSSLARLEQDEALGSNRENWLSAVRQFRKTQLMRKNEELTVSSLFMQGRLYRQMYERFRIPLDLDNAIDSFYDVAALYPKSYLADDALYYAAEASLLHPIKKEQAKDLLRKVIQDYAHGDQAELATNLLNRLHRPANKPSAVAQQITRPAAVDQVRPLPARGQVATSASASVSNPSARARVETSPAAAPPVGLAPMPRQESDTPGSQAAMQPAQIQPVKFWSSDDYTRIVIPATSAVPFTSTLLEKRGVQPRRLVIDFTQSRLAATSQQPVTIDDGLLKQVRTGQNAPDTVRVVLDIESLSDYKVFSLPDPFRVIVDVHGVKSPGKTQTAAVAPAPQPRVPDSAPVITEPVAVGQPASEPETEVVALRGQKKTAPLNTKSGKKEPLSLAQQLGLGIRHIVIDPGHGGKDPGAIAFGIKEKDVVLRLSKLLATKLKEQHGYEVNLTRTKDVYLPLEERTAIANTKKADLFLSLHVNAHPDKRVGGVETYFLNLASDADAMRVAALENATSTHSIGELQDILQDLLKNAKIDESSRLAQFVHRNLAQGLNRGYKIQNLGVKQAPFYVLIGAEMPAVLVEVSFITNPAEADLLQSESYLDKIASEIVNGITAYVSHHHSAALQY